jgi:hypothetical protein
VSWNRDAGPPLLARRPEPVRPAFSCSPQPFCAVFIELDSSSLFDSWITPVHEVLGARPADTQSSAL